MPLNSVIQLLVLERLEAMQMACISRISPSSSKLFFFDLIRCEPLLVTTISEEMRFQREIFTS
jgi:hypothetical protein